MKALPQLRIEYRKVADLIAYPGNARKHSKEQVETDRGVHPLLWLDKSASDRQGQRADCRSRTFARGTQTRYAGGPGDRARDLTAAQRKALILADNQLALNAGWNPAMLRLELEELRESDFDLDLLGFGADELNALFESDDPLEGCTDEDAAPEPPEIPITKQGDVWLLGDHRVLCGEDDVERLMGSEKAALIFTDLPYNVAYEGYTEEHLTIEGDRMSPEQFRGFLELAFASCRAVVTPTASIYVCHPSLWQREFQNALEAAGFEVRCQIIWAKNTFAWGFGRYKFRHEPIFYAHIAGESDAWYGDKTQSTLWEENKPAANRLHPTMKPVELIERALVNSSRRNDIVADLFGGSGSTLIACERMRRRARLMEIDPRYADVIVRRWQDFTGKEAVLDGGGSFDNVARERVRDAA